MERPALVIVTYKRQELLSNLLRSITELTRAPWRIIIVDNEDSHLTATIVERFATEVQEKWGSTVDDPDAGGNVSRVVYVPMAENTGGSGGLFRGRSPSIRAWR